MFLIPLKKLLSFLFSLFLTCFCIVTFSAKAVHASDSAHEAGDIMGNIVGSDIEVYFYGGYINSYFVNGDAAILAEDLRWYFGFEAEWDTEAKTMQINDYRHIFLGESQKLFDKPGGELWVDDIDISQNLANRPKDYKKNTADDYGRIIGKCYYTNNKAVINGEEIPCYDIDGNCTIFLKDLDTRGFITVWDAETRRLAVHRRREIKAMEADIGTVYIESYKTITEFSQKFFTAPASVSLDGGQEKEMSILYTLDLRAEYFVPIEFINQSGISYDWDGENSTLVLSLPDDLPEKIILSIKPDEHTALNEIYFPYLSVQNTDTSEEYHNCSAAFGEGNIYISLSSIMPALGYSLEEGKTPYYLVYLKNYGDNDS